MPSKSSLSDSSEQYTSVTRRSIKLNSDELDLWEMFHYAGLTLDPQVFRVILDLIRLDIQPKAILDVLESVCPNSKHFVPCVQKETGPKLNQTSISGSSSSRKSIPKTGTNIAKGETSTQLRKQSIPKPDKAGGDSKISKR
ncbi:uncharacterized protein LOC120344869 [Styela clava]|uniref:mitotic-spindle organizing protein 2-like n=1 Tax=Styela clava TaxID=7725 RepID=UPI001939285F|nr:mitotic-spindle organizing protein 2-like [Styela clava]